MPTVSDVARRAGVSTATVSRFVRGEKIRSSAAVRAAIEELGYWPSPTARSLKSGVNYAIGVVVPDITNPFFAAVVKGIEGATRAGPYNIFLCDSDESVRREEEVMADLIRRVDGIILAPATERDKTPVHLHHAGVPMVFIDRELSHPSGFDSVLVDNEGGARRAADYLVSLGHEQITMVSGPLNTTPGRGRYEGFVAGLAAHDLHLAGDAIQFGDFRAESGYEAVLRLLALDPQPTAIFTANNMMTVGALKALYDMRVAVPEQISLIGFDDLDLGPVLKPSLTVIDRPMVEQGALAMRMLLNRLSGDRLDGNPRSVRLDTRLIIRGSCARPQRITSAGQSLSRVGMGRI